MCQQRGVLYVLGLHWGYKRWNQGQQHVLHAWSQLSLSSLRAFMTCPLCERSWRVLSVSCMSPVSPRLQPTLPPRFKIQFTALICSFLVSTLNCCSHVIVTRIFTLSLTLLGLLSSPSPLFGLHSSLTCAFSILTVYALTIARPCPLSIRYYSGFLPPSKKCSSFQACSPPSLLNIYFVLLFIFFIFLSSLLICLPSSSSSSSSSC